jgi:hypothetical protein
MRGHDRHRAGVRDRAASGSRLVGHDLACYERATVERDDDPETDGDDRASRRAAAPSEGALPGGDITVEEMSDASFPASDPPARWTWEVRTNNADANGSR